MPRSVHQPLQVTKKNIPNVVAVDLFCGVGGLTFGLRAAGIRVAAGYDMDPDCRFPYVQNNEVPFYCRDVATLEAQELRNHLPSEAFSLLAGCAPCQPFSTYSRTRKGADDRWGLVRDFVRLARELGPDVVTMENVPQLEHHQVFADAVESLRSSGYTTWWSLVQCTDFGIPQTRKRLVLLGSRFGLLELQVPNDPPKVTVRDVLGGLPPLAAGQVSDDDPLHRACALSPKNLTRIRSSKPGGSWRQWKPSLRAACHRRTSGSTFPSVYARMEWDAPAPTVTTQFFGFGNGRFGHPEQDRAISLREGALLQTFPQDYALEPRKHRLSSQRIGRLVGNAVPPVLASRIGQAIIAHLARR